MYRLLLKLVAVLALIATPAAYAQFSSSSPFAWLYDGVGNPVASATSAPAGSEQALLVRQVRSDAAVGSLTISAADVGSTSTSSQNGQALITGTATAGATAAFTLTGVGALRVQVTGTWSATLVSEMSIDGGTTWVTLGLRQPSVTQTTLTSTFTNNLVAVASVAGATNYRVRATSYTSGTPTVKINPAAGVSSVYAADVLPSVIVDASRQMAVVQSTSPAPTDNGLTVRNIPSGTQTVSGSGTFTTSDLADGSKAGGTAGTVSLLTGGVFNTSAPSLTTGQQAALQLTTAGLLKVDPSGVTSPVSAASLPLPSGASTETTLAKLTQTQGSTSSGQSGPLVQGAVTTAAPSYTTAQTSPLSLSTTGLLRSEARAFDGAGTAITSETANAKQYLDVMIPSDGTTGSAVPTIANTVGGTDGTNLRALKTDTSGEVVVTRVDGYKATYSAAATALATVASATDVFTITGSGSKTIRVTRIGISGTGSTAISVNVSLIKRSAANTSGTSASVTAVPLDSSNAAATATVLSYTGNPSVGAAVGTLRTVKVAMPLTGAAGTLIDMPLGDIGQAVVLRGTSQVLAVNFNSTTVATPSVDIYVEWTEE